MNAILISVLQTVQMVIKLYLFIVIISALISWIQPNPYNPVVQFLNKLTVPAYAVIRRVIPTTFGMIDIAPLILCLILIFLDNLIVNIIIHAL